MQYKYVPGSKSLTGRTRRTTPENWISGPDPHQHELFYAWHKHRAQCRFRREPYELTFEDWQLIWTNPMDFLNRGRQPESLVLTRKDISAEWSVDNCEIITRLDQLRRANEYKAEKRRHARSTI